MSSAATCRAALPSIRSQAQGKKTPQRVLQVLERTPQPARSRVSRGGGSSTGTARHALPPAGSVGRSEQRTCSRGLPSAKSAQLQRGRSRGTSEASTARSGRSRTPAEARKSQSKDLAVRGEVVSSKKHGSVGSWTCPCVGCGWTTGERTFWVQAKAAHIAKFHFELRQHLSLRKLPQAEVEDKDWRDPLWQCPRCDKVLHVQPGGIVGRWARIAHHAQAHPKAPWKEFCLTRKQWSVISIRKAQTTRRNTGVARRLLAAVRGGVGEHQLTSAVMPEGVRKGKNLCLCKRCGRTATSIAKLRTQPCTPLVHGVLGWARRQMMLKRLDAAGSPAAKKLVQTLRDSTSDAQRRQLHQKQQQPKLTHEICNEIWAGGPRIGRNFHWCSRCKLQASTRGELERKMCRPPLPAVRSTFLAKMGKWKPQPPLAQRDTYRRQLDQLAVARGTENFLWGNSGDAFGTEGSAVGSRQHSAVSTPPSKATFAAVEDADEGERAGAGEKRRRRAVSLDGRSGMVGRLQ